MNRYSQHSSYYPSFAVLPAVLRQDTNLPAHSPLTVTSSVTFSSFTLPFSPSQCSFGFISFPNSLDALNYHINHPLVFS